MDDFAKPVGDSALMRVWLCWKVLKFLHDSRERGETFVLVKEVRQVLTEDISDSDAYLLLASLKMVMAIGVINDSHARMRRFFIDQRIGEFLLTQYELYLSEGAERVGRNGHNET